MLTYLHVKNLALIKEAEISFQSGLNVLSGETGAGKSILIGAILLSLGTRSDADLIRSGEDSALSELEFVPGSEELVSFLSEKGFFPEDGVYRFTRRVTEQKSIARINGETVSNAVLREIASRFIEVYGQHELSTLFKEEAHLKILDGFSPRTIGPALEHYQVAYREFRQRNEALKKFSADDRIEEKIAYLTFERDELAEAKLRPGESDEIRDRIRILMNEQKIRESLMESESYLSGETEENLMRAIRSLEAAEKSDPSVAGMVSSLLDAESIISDTLTALKSRVNDDSDRESELSSLSARLDDITRFQLKYGVTEENVKEKIDSLTKEIDERSAFIKDRDEIEASLEALKEELKTAGNALHDARTEAALRFDDAMKKTLGDLNFPMVAFRTVVEKTNRYSHSGADEVSMTFSANPGEPMKPISKVASGGELSRIMLAIKTLSFDGEDRMTWLFDEIDTGISGRTAGAVAEKMLQISAGNQVICISHLPQVVAAADHHYRISKRSDGATTETEVQCLCEEETIREIASLLGNGEPTEAGIASARELRSKMKRKPT